MSTEILEMTKAVDMQPFEEFLLDEGLDILEEMELNRFAHLIYVLRNRLLFCSRGNVTDFSFRVGSEHYEVRVNNNYKGFVSVTNEDGVTGVSSTEYYPYKVDEDDPNEYPAMLVLASMVNEAWYHCNN